MSAANCKLIWFGLLMLLLGARGLPAQTAEPIRLALIAADDELRPATDLLTAELSRSDGVVLLERSEIERILREQSLSAAGRDYLKLGQLVKADGLLIASLGEGSRAGQLSLRLVAVKPGVMLGTASSAWPVDVSSDWARGLVTSFAALFPKTSVLARDATPVSIVNLRSAVRSREGEAIEKELTVLLIERLSRERQVFVLERRNMEALTAETDLTGLNDSEFWNGSYLLEGTLDREGYSRERLTISAQVRPPQGGSPILIEVAGGRTNLSDVVNQLANRLLTALKLQPGGSAWNPRAEADKYFAEAQWAYRWGMLSEAAAASEASWALGRRKADVAALRILSYYENGIDRANGTYDLERKLVTFGPGVRFVPNELTRAYGPPKGSSTPPDNARFNRVRRALTLYCEGFSQFIATNTNPGWEWHDIGVDLLEGASCWLRHYYYVPEGRVGQEEAISDVQGLAREVAGLIGAHRAFTNDFGRDKFLSSKANWGFGLAVKTYRERGTLLETKANWGSYWSATPEAGLTFYRDFIKRGEMPKVRRLFVTPDFLEIELGSRTGGTLPTPRVLSYLSGWKWQDRQRVLDVWHGFVEQLCASTNLQIKTEGLFLKCAQVPSSAEHDRLFREFVAFLEKNGEILLAPDDSIVQDMGTLIEARRTGQVSLDVVLDERKQMVKRLQQLGAEFKARGTDLAKLREMKAYLAGDTYDFMKFSTLLLQAEYRPEEAREILPALSVYRSNLTAQLERSDRELAEVRKNPAVMPADEKLRLMRKNAIHLRGSFSWMDRLEAKLKEKLNPVPSPVVVPPSASALSLRSPVAQSGVATQPPPTNSLLVTRFWSLPDRLPQASEPSQLSIATWCFREGRLWVDARAMRFGSFGGQDTYLNRPAIFSIDLDTLQSQVVSLDSGLFSLPKRGLTEQSPRAFEVYQGWLYVSSTDVIRRHSLKSQIWEDLPIPVRGHARITFIDERMILTTEDSVLEATPDGKDVRVLASSRREPPVTTLDRLKSYDFAPITKGPDGSLLAFVEGKLFGLPRNASDWVLQSTPADLGRANCALFDAGLLLTVISAQNEQTYALRRGSGAAELLLAQPPRGATGNIPARRIQSAANASPLEPRWRMPDNRYGRDQAVYLETNSLWVICGALDRMVGGNAAQSQKELTAVLLEFRYDQLQPTTFTLRLQFPDSPAGTPRRVGMPGGATLLEMTPKGLVIAVPRVSGFWLIPHTQLAEFRKTFTTGLKSSEQERAAR